MAKSKRKYVSKTLNSNKGKTTSAAKAAKTYKKATETRVLARGLANFVQHGTIRNIIESPRVMIERMWNEFRRRDANYEVRRPTHTNNDDYYDVKESTRTEDELNQDDGEDDGDGSSFEEDSSYFDDIKISVMHKYAKSIVERLAKSEEKWLLSYLKMHNFWIRKDTAEYICQNLGIEFNHICRYFKRKYFSKRCRRICLPPSRLYWRIRNVFEIFGSKCDVDTGKPLFSDGDWVKANTILKEVLHGYYSDPPGLNLYQFELTNKGEIKYDLLLQVPLLRCKRDTNALEGSHSHINNAFGPSACGPEIADAILAEHRHHSNLRACQKNLSNFPKIGHYNTWMIDAHVKVYERNHNELLYPTWICASDFAPTEEKFGFVSLVGKELEKEINDTVKVRDDKMTPTAKYLSKACGMAVHPRPWSTEYECKCLYQKLFTEATKIHKNMDKVDELMTRLILKHVDGVKVFPKTKAYNRIYRKRRKHYETLQKASRLMARDETLLHSVNILTAHQKQGYEKPTAEASSDVDMNTEDVNA
ncbi:hypothetical protein CTEN210_12289 [Chaetoceros tenuissimus]|uniref:Uncharacterized protein n=1 Tax=Chaetoceros tenuissimus TaxID=426638 RepID=A0AAD3D176_9STRA|nr:hypothetical protein CTEN210_12289 [Chaetoceros tenuissimus]